MNHMQLVSKLTAVLGSNQRVLHKENELYAYECDGYVAQRGRPRAVVFPETTEEVAAIVQLLHREKVPFLPRGAGTGLSGGATALNNEVVISLVRMNQLLHVDYDNMRAVVQPGFINLQLTKQIAKENAYYAPDPSSQSACTIGGNLAENAGGSHCLKYGVTTNHIVAAKVVLPTGEIAELGATYGDALGYDLLGLLIGSEGTLGIATEITVRILRKPQAVKTIMAWFDRVDEASDTVSQVIGAGIIPAAMEMMDQLAMQAVDKSNYHVGYPADIEAALLIEVDGLVEAVAAETDQIVDICKQHQVRAVRVAETDAQRALWWSSRKMAFGAMGRISPNYLVQDGVIPRTKLTEVLARIREISVSSGLRIANVFHAGDGNLHPLICYDASIPFETEKAMMVGSDILKVCVDVGGSITGEHGVGIEKINDMHYLFTEAELKAQIAVRAVFNPEDLCNSGKLIPKPGRCAEVKRASTMISQHLETYIKTSHGSNSHSM
ncbi:FAD-linked oxidase C-terminal domain-containing protein [Sulfoacidibacillus ferrooxidans]|uniref:FAD-linked oxidoreductase n=1 Tax=Sulfoacidibacillus ferrooxidans TaxID=2005001 RepID=A0A9X2ADA7_9BACL|nr:FAD-linked oxidase C-terminal domain-containing protein [Sulfoacidibacillus ferrooxidans]MCI0182142.1 putative FAD-linked oxidoreductase [Sulfoacidibacillus ferrooxidans]